VKKFGFGKAVGALIQKIIFSSSLFILIGIISIGLMACDQKTPEDPVKQAYELRKQAYELRMSGKADEAKAVLDDAIANNPKYSAAYYELSRTFFHMGLGEEQATTDYLLKSKEAIYLALKNDPENIIYNFFASRIAYFEAYISLSGDEEFAKSQIDKLRELYKKVYGLDPDYYEVSLYLVEVYSVLPKQFGTNYAVAEMYGMTLDSKDAVWGAKAKSILLSKKLNIEDLWKETLATYSNDADALEELGKHYLRENRADEGIQYLEDAIAADSSKNYLYLDIARYYAINAMLDKSKIEAATASTEEAINKYIETDPIIPLKAFAIGFLSKLKSKTDEDEGKRLFEEAKSIDPYFSKMGNIPTMDLFVPPDEVSHNHRYLFRPM